MNISMPGNTALIFEQLFNIIGFDVIPEQVMQPWYEFVTGPAQEDADVFAETFNARFDQMGYA